MSLRWRGPGIEQFVEEFQRSTAETRRESKKRMRAGGKKILEESKAGAPVDESNLEEAHELAITRLSRDNIEMEITVGGFVGGRNVDDYAAEMHEGVYQLGEKSLAKDAGSLTPVGRKFLERAADKHEASLVEAVAETLPGD